MNRKTLALPLTIGLLGAALAGCGGSDGGSDGGAIVVGTTDNYVLTKTAPAPFDPAYAYDMNSWNMIRQSLQTLMAIPRGDGEPIPDAAKNCHFATGDETYTCTLRSGLEFADGSDVTAADVKYSIDRVLAINSDSGVSGLLSGIDHVETRGKSMVIFHLKAPDATFPYKLATPAAGIVSPDRYPQGKLRNGFEVDGSGPYRMKAEVKNDHLVKAVFTRNPHYKGSFKPKNNKVEIRPFATADAMGKALDKGDIDMMGHAMSPAQIRKLSDHHDPHVDLVELPGLEISFLTFDTTSPVVRPKAVRQAIAQLVDRGEVASKVYGNGTEPLYSMVPATITGHANSFFNRYGNPSTAKARSLLEQAHISTPVKLTLHYTTDHYGPATKKEFEVLQRQLNKSGLFDVSLKGTTWDKYRPDQVHHKYALSGLHWFPDFPDPDNFLAPFFGNNNVLHTPYSNKKITDTWIPAERRQADRLSANKTLQKIQDAVAEDVPVLPLWQGKQYVAARDDIQGAEWSLNSSSVLQLWELSRGVGS